MQAEYQPGRRHQKYEWRDHDAEFGEVAEQHRREADGVHRMPGREAVQVQHRCMPVHVGEPLARALPARQSLEYRVHEQRHNADAEHVQRDGYARAPVQHRQQ